MEHVLKKAYLLHVKKKAYVSQASLRSSGLKRELAIVPS
jgi:hypothetical protein